MIWLKNLLFQFKSFWWFMLAKNSNDLCGAFNFLNAMMHAHQEILGLMVCPFVLFAKEKVS
jgi:hypothetical protein